ncbi:alpha/beta fold hydrolase [Frigoriglobus tundricola]|nr:alpha/beta fold hydrolase [Frigoriglobus tundricola]
MSNTPASDAPPPLRTTRLPAADEAAPFPNPAPDLYPFTPRVAARRGLRMSYLDEGRGDPVVMLHGNPTWSFYYRNLVLALRESYRCIVPDHIGCGLSDKPSPSEYDYSLKHRIDDLEWLLEERGLTKDLTLVLHDWGGMIGMGFAARHPDRIKRIVASNTGAFPLPPGKRFPRSLWLGRNTRLGAWLITRRNAFCEYAAKWCVTRKPLPAEVRAAYLAPYDTPAHRVAVLKFVQTIPLKPGDDGFDIVSGTAAALDRFRTTPTLLLWGMKDFVFDGHFLEEWKRHFPHAEVHTWPDCGHYLLDDAGELAIMRVWEFLQRHPIQDAP